MTHTFGADDKPLDFGYGGISGCLTHTGRFVAINHYHPIHGYVTLTTAPPFPDDARYDPARVRAYRRDLVKQGGFGVLLSSDVIQTVVEYDAHDNPILTMTLSNGVTATCITQIESSSLIQNWSFSARTILQITGEVYLMRCPYPQLTEGGVLPPVGHETVSYSSNIKPLPDDTIRIYNPDLRHEYTIYTSDITLDKKKNEHDYLWIHGKLRQTHFVIRIMPIQTPYHDDAVYGLAMASPYDTPISPPDNHQSVRRNGMYSVLEKNFSAISPHPSPSPLHGEGAMFTHQKGSPPLLHNGEGGRGDEVYDPLHLRAWRYARLCATPTEHDTLCILTDHMILPLSWNRDAYYTARLFLDHPQTHILTQKHLLWMFETAERLNGLWGRSYLANGKIKDKGYQLDQQLFPLLELAEYVQITGDTALLDHLRGYIQPIFTALASHRALHALLYATDETPADDPIAQPYPLSSHILLWKVLVELEKIGCADMCPHTPNDIASSILKHFIGDHHGKAIFAYATDGHGGHHFYHDANDVPLVLMPVWGFCHKDDPVWQGTMDFAFSDANIGGFYDGVLGSVHTPAPWALGDCQEWIFSRIIGDTNRENMILARLHHASQWDGALSEAYDRKTGDIISRHWFLWTNALYACIKRGIFDVE